MILAAMLLTAIPMKAQIFLSDADLVANLRAMRGGNNVNPWGPGSGGSDVNGGGEFAPIGSGILVLSCLGGAYLLGKRKKLKDTK